MGNDNHSVTNVDPNDGVEQLLNALSSSVRRKVVYFLLEHESATLEELVDVVTTWQATHTDELSTPSDRKRVEIGLHHRDLPALEDAGIVEMRDDRDIVSFVQLTDSQREILESVLEADRSDAPLKH